VFRKEFTLSRKKIAIVTGGSRGIGAATAELFAKNDYSVCINYKSREDAALKVAHNIAELGGSCVTVQADVSKEQDVVLLLIKSLRFTRGSSIFSSWRKC